MVIVFFFFVATGICATSHFWHTVRCYCYIPQLKSKHWGNLRNLLERHKEKENLRQFLSYPPHSSISQNKTIKISQHINTNAFDLNCHGNQSISSFMNVLKHMDLMIPFNGFEQLEARNCLRNHLSCS